MYNGIVFHSLATLTFIGLTIGLWQALRTGRPVEQLGRYTRAGLLVALAFQGIALSQQTLGPGLINLNWAVALSAAIWLGLIVYWIESLVIRIDGIQLIMLPLAALSCLLASIFHTTSPIITSADWFMRGHLLLAFSAYGLITIAAVQALLMAATDYHLHHPISRSDHPNKFIRTIDRVLDAQPPLLTQERLLFRLIWVAFGVLTLTVLSGTVITYELTGQLLTADHKTVFTLLSWITFAILLAGRIARGWRGRIALRYTLVGFVFVLLAYSGSQFVVDVILHKV
ncbi:cytochrome C assembly family protein [Orrella sp. 11846]|uniref:cytochrome C assembly family protein n=1 Tax=Orrella sp. 11846 TaxID=3409913 RepID=UPI003B5C5EC6